MMLKVDHFFINELVTIIQNGKKYRAITNPDKPITNRRFVVRASHAKACFRFVSIRFLSYYQFDS